MNKNIIRNRKNRRKAKKLGNVYKIHFEHKETKKKFILTWCTYEALNLDVFLKRLKIQGEQIKKEDYLIKYEKIQEKKV